MNGRKGGRKGERDRGTEGERERGREGRREGERKEGRKEGRKEWFLDMYCLAAFRLLFGFMVVTAFLSMWLSNTATTAMMFPIAQAILHELEQGTEDGGKNDGFVNDGSVMEDKGNDKEIEMQIRKESAIKEADNDVRYVVLKR